MLAHGSNQLPTLTFHQERIPPSAVNLTVGSTFEKSALTYDSWQISGRNNALIQEGVYECLRAQGWKSLTTFLQF